MPGRREHEEFERKILGRSYPEVHKMKDSMAPTMGPRHRRFFHDIYSDVALAIIFKDPGVGISAFLHDCLDFSQDQRTG